MLEKRKREGANITCILDRFHKRPYIYERRLRSKYTWEGKRIEDYACEKMQASNS